MLEMHLTCMLAGEQKSSVQTGPYKECVAGGTVLVGSGNVLDGVLPIHKCGHCERVEEPAF